MKRKILSFILFSLLLFPVVFLSAENAWGTLFTHETPLRNNYGLISDGLLTIKGDGARDGGSAEELTTYLYTDDLYRISDAMDYYIASATAGKAMIMQTAEAYGIAWTDWGTYVPTVDVATIYSDERYLYTSGGTYIDDRNDLYTGRNATVLTTQGKLIGNYSSINRAGLLPSTDIRTDRLASYDDEMTYTFTDLSYASTLPTLSAVDDTVRRLAQLQYDRGYKRGFEVKQGFIETGIGMWSTTLSAYGVRVEDYKDASTVRINKGDVPDALITYSPNSYGSASGYVQNKQGISLESIPAFVDASTEETILGTLTTYAAIDDGIRRMAQIQYNSGYNEGYNKGAYVRKLLNQINKYPSVQGVIIKYHVHDTEVTDKTQTLTATGLTNARALISQYVSAVQLLDDEPKATSGGCYTRPFYYYNYNGSSGSGFREPPAGAEITNITYFPNCRHSNGDYVYVEYNYPRP